MSKNVSYKYFLYFIVTETYVYVAIAVTVITNSLNYHIKLCIY